jgi:hypothetical protein
VPQALGRNRFAADNYVETYEGNGKSQLLLRQRPIIQISSIAGAARPSPQQGDPIWPERDLDRWANALV